MNSSNNPNNPTLADLSARLDTAESRACAAESRYVRAEKRFRVLCAGLFGAITVAVSLPFVSPAIAQGYGMTLAQAATRIAALETKTASMSVVAANDSTNTSGYQTVRFSGVNVQIVNGAGLTEFTNNGVGNLIIGYNELRGSNTDIRTGSHNLVVGLRNSYSGDGGAVIGYQNSISGTESCVVGGEFNTASNTSACVSGGSRNTASGPDSSVSGGTFNVASGSDSSVSGGTFNVASGSYSSVSGGTFNVASGSYSSVSGGDSRTASGDFDWAAGALFQNQ